MGGLSHSSRQLHSPDGSDTLKTAIHVFHRQLQPRIIEGKTDHRDLTWVLSTLVYLDPFQNMEGGELGFLWITEILDSGYQEHQRERMANAIMGSLGRHFFHKNPMSFINVEPGWIPPLLGFLSLSEKLATTRSSGFIALRILAASPGSADFGPVILPILHSTLLPTDRLHARWLALNVFLRFMPGWFSSRMENIPSKDLGRLVQAVGDPFQFPDLPLQDGKPVDPSDYDPMMAAAVLIEFASSDLWRNHLRRPNFTSFEEIVSTWEGKRTALRRMLEIATDFLPTFLSTATKITMAIRRLEELQYSNTAEVVVMWAWTVGVVSPMDHDGSQVIGCDTLRFYQTHGTEHLIALKRHIVDGDMFLFERHRRESGVDIFVKLPVLKNVQSGYQTHLYLSQACQLRRLYQLFGYDLTMRKGAVAAEVDEKMDVSPGSSVALAPFVDWACDDS